MLAGSLDVMVVVYSDRELDVWFVGLCMMHILWRGESCLVYHLLFVVCQVMIFQYPRREVHRPYLICYLGSASIWFGAIVILLHES